MMQYTRIYVDKEGNSHFEVVDVPLTDKGLVGALSAPMPVKNVIFRENKKDYDWDFHTAPARQFIILLDGEIEIMTSLGEVRQFKAGDILLVEDTTGKGHKTKNISIQERRSIFIEL
jgi:hypothetical protein